MRYRHITIVVFLLLAATLLTSQSSRAGKEAQGATGIFLSVLAPVQEQFSAGVVYLRGLWSEYVDLVGVGEENIDLRSRVKELELKVSAILELELENERLRSLLSFTNDKGLTGRAAQVIGRSMSPYVHTITINLGEKSGVTPGMAVLDGQGAVGQVRAVSANSSSVLLISDSSSAVDVIVQRSRASGILEGRSQSVLSLRYILADKPVEPGERVVTSGMDGVYPKGLFAGVVLSAKQDSSALFQEVTVKPSVDLERVESVFVVGAGSNTPTLTTAGSGVGE